MKNIYVLWPTIRPQMCCETLEIWQQNSRHDGRIEYWIGAENEGQRRFILRAKIKGLSSYVLGKATLPEALTALSNKMIKENAVLNDIVIFGQDDMFPPKDWDKVLDDAFSVHYGAVCFNDGIQIYPEPVCTMPCLSVYALSQLNGIIFHPEYKHLWSDTEFYLNCQEMGLMKDVRLTNPAVFEHRHYIKGLREKDNVDVNTQDNAAQDRLTFERRMKLPLAERLKI